MAGCWYEFQAKSKEWANVERRFRSGNCKVMVGHLCGAIEVIPRWHLEDDSVGIMFWGEARVRNISIGLMEPALNGGCYCLLPLLPRPFFFFDLTVLEVDEDALLSSDESDSLSSVESAARLLRFFFFLIVFVFFFFVGVGLCVDFVFFLRRGGLDVSFSF